MFNVKAGDVCFCKKSNIGFGDNFCVKAGEYYEVVNL
jgi:hypothetical protein